MSRRGDMPRGLARLDGEHASPRRAVIVVGVIIAASALQTARLSEAHLPLTLARTF